MRLLPNKLEILKYQSHSFPFMPNWRINCSNLPASAPTKRYMLRCVMYLSLQILFSSSAHTTFTGSIFSYSTENYMWKSWFALCIHKELPKASITYKYACTNRQTHLYNLDWQECSAFRHLPTAIFLLFFAPQVSDVRADAEATGNIPVLPVIQPSCPPQTFVVVVIIQIHIFLMHFPRCANVARC